MSDSDNGSDKALSSDDDVEAFSRRKLPRFQYPTFENHGDDGHDGARDRRPRRSKEEATYGVFLEDPGSDDDEESYGNTRKRRRNHQSNLNYNKSATTKSAPLFVKGKTLEPEDTKKDDDEEEKAKQKGNEAASVEEKEPKDADPDPEDEELRLKQEEANQKFLSLLNRGRGISKKPPSGDGDLISSTKSSSAQVVPTPASHNDELSPTGLGSRREEPSSAPAYDQVPTNNSVGLGFSPEQQTQSHDHEDQNDGFAKASNIGLGMPSQFGRKEYTNNKRRNPLSPPIKKNPNLGTWEKHTKGIGMKLMAKMGYRGSGGLGSKRRLAEKKTGISRPVEVVVRPNNLGLGFGNFKEASKLKANQQIEAEVSGKRPPSTTSNSESQKVETMDKSSKVTGAQRSMLPGVKDLLNEQSWKQRGKKRKRPRRTVIPYTELLETQKPSVVIDMRGPIADDNDSNEEGTVEKKVPLAEELLHNVSMLLNTYENRTNSLSLLSQSTKKKVISLDSDIESMRHNIRQGRERIEKTQKAIQILDKISALDEKSSNDGMVGEVELLVRELRYTFTAEERAMLKFNEILVPSLLGNVVQARINEWNPLTEDSSSSERLIRSLLSLASSFGGTAENDNNNRDTEEAMKKFLLAKHLLPRVKSALESTRWDPVLDTDRALKLCELLYQVTLESVPAATARKEHDVDEESPVFPEFTPGNELDLAGIVKSEIMQGVVYEKLSTSLRQWRPDLDENGKLANSPDVWILPWIPHLDHRAILPMLISDCKKKLKTCLSFLSKSLSDDENFIHAAIQALRPWRGVLKADTLLTMVSSGLAPRLACGLSREVLEWNLVCRKWTITDAVFELHGLNLLSDREFLSIIEGELLSHWASSMHKWSSEASCDTVALAKMYAVLKLKLLKPLADSSLDTLRSMKLLQRDERICRIFYGVLLMIKAASESNLGGLGDLCPPVTNFRRVLARRAAEDKRKEEDDLVRMDSSGVASGAFGDDVEARVRLHRRSGTTPTFREVVEEFASEREILFQPRIGTNATKDGKQVFLFGQFPVYLDANVIFMWHETVWRPISLDSLASKVNPTS